MLLQSLLLRPGRFDRQITVGYPDVRGREAILRVHAKEKPLADDVDLANIAKRTPYFAGADLENIMNEAAILCAREGKDKITMRHLNDAIERVSISGRGTVVTGTIKAGTLRVNDRILIIGKSGRLATQVDGLEAFHKIMERAETGEYVGVLLRDVKSTDVEKGDLLLKG